jgi:hypothetical protein
MANQWEDIFYDELTGPGNPRKKHDYTIEWDDPYAFVDVLVGAHQQIRRNVADYVAPKREVSPAYAETRARFQADLEDPRHGTLNGYTNLKCRCGPCIEAHKAYKRGEREELGVRTLDERANARKAFLSDLSDPRHGTINGYNGIGCRCDRCREAARVYGREWRRKAKETA